METIRGRWAIATAMLGMALACAPGAARADGLDAGGYLGAAFPVGHYGNTVDIGGALGGWAGYQWRMNDKGAISLIANPQFTLLPVGDCSGNPCGGGSPASEFSFSVGPKATLIDGPIQLSLAILGGYFRDINGPLDESGAGVVLHGTAGRDVTPNLNLGLFVRFEEQFLAPEVISNNDDRQMVMAGVTLGWHEAPPPPPAPLPPPPPPPAPVKRKLVLRGVNFDFDKSNIRPDARPILDEAVATLKKESGIRVKIEGHTDNVGSDAYNKALSNRRAKSVAAYLESGGIAASRLTEVGMGESQPVASNDTAEGRAQNRRVELKVLE